MDSSQRRTLDGFQVFLKMLNFTYNCRNANPLTELQLTEIQKTRRVSMPAAAVPIGTTLWGARFSDSAVPIQEFICADTHECVLSTLHGL